jgi:hypothetical protein
MLTADVNWTQYCIVFFSPELLELSTVIINICVMRSFYSEATTFAQAHVCNSVYCAYPLMHWIVTHFVSYTNSLLPLPTVKKPWDLGQVLGGCESIVPDDLSTDTVKSHRRTYCMGPSSDARNAETVM